MEFKGMFSMKQFGRLNFVSSKFISEKSHLYLYHLSHHKMKQQLKNVKKLQ